jgi:hypothetical protein
MVPSNSCVWTANEEQLLKQLAGRATVNKISSLMGRTRQSIRSKATKLGLSLNFKRTQWDEDVINEIVSLRNQGMDWVSIGKQMKKSSASCQRAYSRHICEERKRKLSKQNTYVDVLKSVLEKVEILDEHKVNILKAFREALEN